MEWQKDFFMGINLYDGILAKSLIWFIFLLLGFVVVVFALLVIKLLTSITNRFKVNKVIAGSFILGIITSLPELTISVASSASGFPENSFNNILGSSLFYIFIFSFFMLYFSLRYKKIITGGNSIGNVIFTFFVSISLFFVFLPSNISLDNNSSALSFLAYTIPKINISLLIFLFFIVYILYSVISIVKNIKKNHGHNEFDTYVYSSAQKVKKWIDIKIENLTKIKLIFYFIVSSILLILFAFGLSMVVDVVPHVYGIPETSASGLFLSFITNTPEILSTVILFKNKEFVLVKGNFQGTLAFNLIIPFFSDLSFSHQGLLSFLTMHSSEMHESYSSVEYLQVFSLVTLLLIMYTLVNIIENIKNKKIIMSLFCSEIILYVSGWTIILSGIQ